VGPIFGWLVFPLVPVVLEDLFYQTCNLPGPLFGVERVGPDPREWTWFVWIILLGPLLGYGFLAGATVDLPDDLGTTRGRLRRLLARRALWVSIGPWTGFLICAVLFFTYAFLSELVPAIQGVHLPNSWQGSWTETALTWITAVSIVGVLSYGWLWPAWAAMRRAARLERWRRALFRGFAIAFGFVASLFGSFWAVTAYWRNYFFDARVVPLLAVALGLACLSGCGGTITYGELRRRELFRAMLVAWVLGLALMWRWWSRARPRSPH
jgi:hypothetical protein